jgi:hypothetical protein
MPTSIYGGFLPQPGRWHSGVKLGGINTLPIECVVDETLPSLGQDFHFPNRDFVVIPRGRVIGARGTDLTRLLGTTVLTLATGVDPLNVPSQLSSLFQFAGNYPVGYAPFHIYRDFSGMPADKPVPVNHETTELPYTVINEAYNTSYNGGSRLLVGERVMPYWGSNIALNPAAQDKGKWVRFVQKQVWSDTYTTPSGGQQLTRAPFPAFLPKVIFAWTNTGAVLASGATSVTYNETFQKWCVTFSQNNVAGIVYEYGAADGMAYGFVAGIEPVGTAGGINSSSHELGGWLKWITDQFGLWEWPPITGTRPFTQVTNETLSVTNNTAVVANKPIIPYKALTITVTGTVRAADGTATTLNGATLNLADTQYFNDYSQGQYYDLDFLSGTLTFSSNLTVTAATISYFYESNFKEGLKWDAGIIGLTDGRDSGIIGLPTHLDVAGVRGVLRVAVVT